MSGGTQSRAAVLATRATDYKETETKALRESNRQLRAALKECHEMLERAEETLRESGQDNDRR